MSGKPVSEAVRELEQLLEEGFLSEEQFRREVRELLESRRTVDEGEGRAASRALDEAVRHAPPAEGGEPVAAPEPVAASEPAAWYLEDAPDASPTPFAPGPGPQTPAKPFEPGRVIIKGKTPWDDKGSDRIHLSVPGREGKAKDDEAVTIGTARRPLNPIERQHLARLAERTNKVVNKQKNPDLAFFLSLVLPGLGQAYYGELGGGVLLMFLGGAGWVGLFMQEWWVLYVLAPLGLLAGALAHRSVLNRNRHLDMRRRADINRKQQESRLNVEKSIRQAGAAPPPRHR